jgi:hypothetical protein
MHSTGSFAQRKVTGSGAAVGAAEAPLHAAIAKAARGSARMAALSTHVFALRSLVDPYAQSGGILAVPRSRRRPAGSPCSTPRRTKDWRSNRGARASEHLRAFDSDGARSGTRLSVVTAFALASSTRMLDGTEKRRIVHDGVVKDAYLERSGEYVRPDLTKASSSSTS